MFVRVSGCVTGWIVHAHTHSPGAIRYIPPPPRSQDHLAPPRSAGRLAPLSVQDCLDHCEAARGSLLVGACLGVDVEFSRRDGAVVCWIHSDLRRLNHKYRHPRVIQYIAVRCPQQQGL